MAMSILAGILSTVFLAQIAVAQGDPCTVIGGKSFVSPADFRACEKAFPFNETLRQNVLTNAAKVLDGFFTFIDYYSNSPPPFQESTVDIWGEINRINTTVYETDYDFNWDLYKFSMSLNDGHTKWRPSCYTSVQNILPAPVVSLSIHGKEDLYIAPDSVEYLSLVGEEFVAYFDSIGFDWKRLAGAKILEIEGMKAYDYVDKVAREVSGNFLDHGVRVNSAYTSYRISRGQYSQRLGDLAGPLGVEQDSLTMKLILRHKRRPETVTIPFVASFSGSSFIDKETYWENNCVATEDTNGIDYKGDTGRSHPRFPKAEILEDAQGQMTGVDLPPEFHPTLPPTPGSEGVLRSYILDGNKTGVMFVGSFGPSDFYKFQTDVVEAISAIKQAGATNLIIDLTDNGGGYVCLGHFLFKYLVGSKNVDNPGFQSSGRASGIARRIVAADIELGLTDSYTFYTADNYAYIENNTQIHNTYNYMEPPVIEKINGKDSPVSQRYFDTCELYFEEDIPEDPPFALEDIMIVGNGWCASTCAMFSTLMFEKAGTKIASFGAKHGEIMEFKGMAGNQVLDWADLASEIKTADMEDDPDTPPDLLVAGNFRVNWRTAYSWLDTTTPIQYRSEPAQYRFPYTLDTYLNPQNLWSFIERKFFHHRA